MTSTPQVDGLRIHRAQEFSPSMLACRKGTTTVSVCLPARNEAKTVGAIVESIVSHFAPGVGNALVDEVVVIDDRSTDATADVAAAAGAKVVAVGEVLPETGAGAGKGNAMWKSVAFCTGDIIVWIDADLVSFTPAYVLGLVGPLLVDPEVAMVKGFYERPEQAGASGGRTTELMARPLLSTFFPELSAIHQPLGGEYSVRRELVEQVPFAQGYGVETGLLIDIARLVGVSRIAQVDLGIRSHRNRPLRALSAQAMEVLHAVLHRLDIDRCPDGPAVLQRPDAGPVGIQVAERPPLNEVPGYLRQ